MTDELEENSKLRLAAEEYCRQNALDPNEFVQSAHHPVRRPRWQVVAQDLRDLRQRLAIMDMVFAPPRLNVPPTPKPDTIRDRLTLGKKKP